MDVGARVETGGARLPPVDDRIDRNTAAMMPARDFPLVLRDEWRSDRPKPRLGRLRALAIVRSLTTRTKRPVYRLTARTNATSPPLPPRPARSRTRASKGSRRNA